MSFGRLLSRWGQGCFRGVTHRTARRPAHAGLLGALERRQAVTGTARRCIRPVGPDARTLVDWHFCATARPTWTPMPLSGRPWHWPLADRLQRDAERLAADADPAQVRRSFPTAPADRSGQAGLAFALRDTIRRGRRLARDLWLGRRLSGRRVAPAGRFRPGAGRPACRAGRCACCGTGARAAARNLLRLDDGHVALARARIALQARSPGWMRWSPPCRSGCATIPALRMTGSISAMTGSAATAPPT